MSVYATYRYPSYTEAGRGHDALLSSGVSFEIDTETDKKIKRAVKDKIKRETPTPLIVRRIKHYVHTERPDATPDQVRKDLQLRNSNVVIKAIMNGEYNSLIE